MKLLVEEPDGRRLTFEGEVDELAEVAAKLRGSGAGRLTPTNGQTTPSKTHWDEQSVKRLLTLLWGEQQKLVKFVVAKETPTYEDVQKHMGYGKQNLSGVLSAITRNSQKATGTGMAQLIDWKYTADGKRRYFCHPDALPFLKQLIK